MAGDWIKVELELPDKPEVHYMAGMLNLDCDAVVGKLLRVWGWFDKHTVDGNAHGVTFALLDRLTGVTGFGEAMCHSGWLVQNGHTLTVPNFGNHNGETAKKRALTAKRVSKFKEKVTQEVTQPALVNALPREEKRREEENLNTLSGNPDVAPLVEKNREAKEAAKRVLAFLNEKTGRAYRPVDANVKPIVARLSSGATEGQCRQIIAKKTREWMPNPAMVGYLRPATLFNATKFEQYLGELV